MPVWWNNKLGDVNMKVYGPYIRKDGRKHVIIISEDGTRKTVSYPKWLMEQHLGRQLDPNLETIDHIDGDFTNNDISNLRIIPRSKHTSEDNIRAKLVEVTCVLCGAKVFRRAVDIRHHSKQGKSGPFCSRSCAGKYGTLIQNNIVEKMPIQKPVDSIYYKVNKQVS